MGIGPSPAIKNLLKKNNLKLDDIGLFDVSFKSLVSLLVELKIRLFNLIF